MIPFSNKPMTTYSYDAAGDLQSIRRADGSVSEVVQHESGNSYTVYNADGSTELHTWDETSATTQKISADGTVSIERIERDSNDTLTGRIIRRITPFHGETQNPN